MGAHCKVMKGWPLVAEPVLQHLDGTGFSGCRRFAETIIREPHAEHDLPEHMGMGESWIRPEDPLGLIPTVQAEHPGHAEEFVACLKAVAEDPDAWIVIYW